jgi:prepilin signal peptidase PulO-like enzyme (type II secretory pathway)
MLLLSLLAGWLVNLAADTLPERRPLGQTWHWPLRLLPASFWQRWGLELPDAIAPWPRRRTIVVWLLALALGWLTYIRVGWGIGGMVLALHSWYFLTIAVIDLEHRLVLNRLLLPALPVLLLATASGRTLPAGSALLGAAMGFGLFLLLVLVWPGGMGMGDAKLAGIIGLATGFSGVVIALAIGICAGGLSALVVLTRHGFRRGQTMAYAPYLVLGAWVALYFGAELWRLYLEYIWNIG